MPAEGSSERGRECPVPPPRWERHERTDEAERERGAAGGHHPRTAARVEEGVPAGRRCIRRSGSRSGRLPRRPRGARQGSAWVETPNPPVQVYDTSGPYTDPEARIDLRRGLEPVRDLAGARPGAGDAPRGHLGLRPGPRGGSAAAGAADGAACGLPGWPGAGGNVTQLHAARKGIVTPEMEAVALRESLVAEQAAEGQHRGPVVRREPARAR